MIYELVNITDRTNNNDNKSKYKQLNELSKFN